MPDYNIIYIHWKKYQIDFNNNLKKLQVRLDADSIHDIRVATKKLRAILTLYNSLNTESKWDYLLKKTDLLFDALGKYRDIDICISLIKKIEKNTDIHFINLKIYLSASFKLIKGWTNLEIHRFKSTELSRISLLLKQEKKILSSDDFLFTLLKHIQEQIIEAKKNIRQPHKMRKSLKEIYYWISIFPDEQANSFWHSQELHTILDEYGSWQDYEILELKIKYFKKDIFPKSFKEYDQLKELQIQIAETKKMLLININLMLKAWTKKVISKINSKA